MSKSKTCSKIIGKKRFQMAPMRSKLRGKKFRNPGKLNWNSFGTFFYQFRGNVIMNVKLILKPYFKKALIFLTLIDLELTKLPETVQMETFISSEIILELWKGLV